jgi:Phospholipase_D-nuclease N-terminal
LPEGKALDVNLKNKRTIMLGGIIGGWEIILLFFLIFWVVMLIDCIKNKSLTGNEKIVWVLVIALTNWLGALIYFFVGRRKT